MNVLEAIEHMKNGGDAKCLLYDRERHSMRRTIVMKGDEKEKDEWEIRANGYIVQGLSTEYILAEWEKC